VSPEKPNRLQPGQEKKTVKVARILGAKLNALASAMDIPTEELLSQIIEEVIDSRLRDHGFDPDKIDWLGIAKHKPRRKNRPEQKN
jgi:hypothetical protein